MHQAEYEGVLVKLKSAEVMPTVLANGSMIASEVESFSNDVHVFDVATSAMSETIRLLQEDPAVEYAEPNWIRTALGTEGLATTAKGPLDDEWYMSVIGANRSLAAGFRGEGVLLAVLDSGVGPHPLVDDNVVIRPGFDYVNNDFDPADDFGHGTHVAGLLQAVAPDVKIASFKVLNRAGQGTDAAISRGIREAVDAGVKIINMSLGGRTRGINLCGSVVYALDKGVTVVAASGNGATTIDFPAGCDPRVVVVGATDRAGGVAWYSNTGAEIDVVAPGGGKRTDDDQLLSAWLDGGYARKNGTSMATPLVSGAIAVLLASDNSVSSGMAGQLLCATASDLAPEGKDNSSGCGMLNIPKLLSLAEPVMNFGVYAPFVGR
jgi:subtilisin family serine protease